MALLNKQNMCRRGRDRERGELVIAFNTPENSGKALCLDRISSNRYLPSSDT